MLLKDAHALIDCIGGLEFFLVSTSAIARLVNALTQEELIEDPNDFLATRLSDRAQHFSVGSKQFYGFCLVSRGLIFLTVFDLFVVVLIWREYKVVHRRLADRPPIAQPGPM